MTKNTATLAMAIGVALVGSATTASATVYPTCGYTQAYFANGSPGDVVVYPTSNSGAMVRTIMNDTGQQFGHVAAISAYGGAQLTESTWDDNQPPSQGGCADPIDVNSLRNLMPGISYHASYGNNVYLLKGASTYGGCYYANAAYHIHSLTTNIGLGDCSTYLTNQCGVASVGGYNVATNNAATDLYFAVKNYVATRVSWYHNLFCGGISTDQLADRGAKQVLNETFFGWGDQNLTFYPNYVQWPDPASYAAYNWPAYVSPGPSPDGIYYAAAQQGRPIYSGQTASSTYSCTCPYGYTYNASYGTCDLPVSGTFSGSASTCTADSSGYCNSNPAYITFSTTNATNGASVYVSCNGGGWSLFANATYQSSYVGWIPTSGCTFELHAGYNGLYNQTLASWYVHAVAGSSCTYTCAQYAGYGCGSANTCCSFGGWGCDSAGQCLVNNGCSAQQQPPSCSSGYTCSAYGWYAGMCSGGWYCDGTCINYTGCY